MKHRSAWDELQEQWIASERLSDSQERERLKQAAVDPMAAGELAFYERARHWLESPKSEADSNARFAEHAFRQVKGGRNAALRLVAEGQSRLPESRTRSALAPRRSASTAAWLIASALIAVALAVTVSSLWRGNAQARAAQWLGLGGTRAAQCQLVSFSGVIESSGAAQPNLVGGLFHEGDTLATKAGTACVSIDGSARVCLRSDSRIAFRSLDPKNVRIDVERGGSIASLSPRPAGSFFSLIGQGVVATAHGTVFAVELGAALGTARVLVFEGSVDVSRASAATRIRAGNGASYRAGDPSPSRASLADPERAEWLAWLGLPIARAAQSSDSPQVEHEAVPVQAANEAGNQHQAASALSPEQAEPAAPLSRDALFAAARKQASLGNARAARALYRELVTRFPGQGTASVQVVLGNLEMELAAPERALTAFDAYSRAGGPLDPEALHGKVRALRALGRKAEESATIRTYLARYPNGFQAPALRKRLEELE